MTLAMRISKRSARGLVLDPWKTSPRLVSNLSAGGEAHVLWRENKVLLLG